MKQVMRGLLAVAVVCAAVLMSGCESCPTCPSHSHACEMKMKCPGCGQECPKGAKSCQKCGKECPKDACCGKPGTPGCCK